jgi:hypothetical protein
MVSAMDPHGHILGFLDVHTKTGNERVSTWELKNDPLLSLCAKSARCIK